MFNDECFLIQSMEMVKHLAGYLERGIIAKQKELRGESLKRIRERFGFRNADPMPEARRSLG